MNNEHFAKAAKSVYTVILFLIIFALAFNSLEAKRNSYSKGDGTGRLTELKEKLKLTDEQVNKLTPILKSHNSQVKSIKEKYKDGGPDERAKMREEVKAIYDKTYIEAGRILSKEQLDQFKNIIKQSSYQGSKGKSKGSGRGNRGNN